MSGPISNWRPLLLEGNNTRSTIGKLAEDNDTAKDQSDGVERHGI